MADNASIARPYAKAVFELAKDTNAFESWADLFELVTEIVADADFANLVNDPKVSGDQVADLLVDLCKDRLPEGGENLFKLLVKNDRVPAISDIHQQYTDLVAQAKQSVNAQVITAMALTDAQKAALSAALEKRLGLKVNLQESIDESLIGGAIVRAGDLVIDGSAQGRIEKLAAALA